MKRKITILTTALALLAFLTIPMGMWGQTRDVETFTFSELGYGNAEDVTTVVGNDVTLTFDAGTNASNSPKYYTTGAGVRMYVGNTLEVALNDQTGDTRITAIEFTFSASNYTGGLQNWTGSETSHTFTATGTARIQVIAVTFSEGGTAPITYTVTYYANVVGTAPVVDTYIEGADVTLRDANTFTNDGYTFSEWNTQADGDGDAYEAGEVIEGIEDNIELYAIWTENPVSDEQWVLANLADLTESDVFVIVGNNGSNYAMSNDKGTGNPPTAVAVTVTNDAITSTVATNIQWNISGNATDGYTFYPNGSTTTWLYCTSANNGVRVGTNDNKTFVINSDYLYNSATGRHVGIYNNQDWRCYLPSSTGVHNNIAGQTFAFYKKVTGGVVPPSITAENVSIEYNVTEGAIEYTINNGVEGGTLAAATESDWLTLGEVGTTVPFTCSANEAGTDRTATVTLTYTYDRTTVTKDVTVTQAGDPNATMTIAEVRAQGTGAVVTTGTITSISGNGTKTAYMQDATAAIVVYGSFTAAVGDEIRVAGTLTTYQGLMEITSPSVTVISQGNTIDPELMTIAEINASTNQGWYIRVEEATVTNISGSNTTIAQGNDTILVYGNLGVTVAINDIISLNGNIGNHNGVQIANPQNVEVQAAPAEPSVTVIPATVNAPAEGADGTLAITYENIPELISFDYYFCDAEGNELEEDPDWIDAEIQVEDEVYSVYYVIDANDGDARTAYFKVYTFAGDELEEVYSIVTVNQAAYVVDYATLPFEFNGGRADIENTVGLTQEGLGSDYNSAPKLKFDGTGDWLLLHFNEEPGILTFDIKGNGFSDGTFTVQASVDGETYEDLVEYTVLGATDRDTIDNLAADVRYIKWIYTEKVGGNVALGNINLDKPAVPVPSITITPALVEVDADEHDGTLDLAYAYLEISDMTDFAVQFYNAEGEELDENPEWIEVLVAEQDPTVGEGYVVSYTVDANDGEARTAYFKVFATGDEDFVYSNLVTINQAALVVGQQFALFGGNLVEGDYIIYYDGKAMNNVVSSGRLQYAEIEPEDNVITTDNAAIIWHIALNDEGYWTIYSADANAYAASTGVKNKAQMLEDGTDDMAMWTVTEINGTYEFVNKANAAGDVNANLRNNGTYGFACYATSTGGALSLYKCTETVATYTLEIAGYGNNAGGYYLIASPVVAVAPTVDNGFLTDAFDLYYFDQAQEGEEWRNYEASTFNLLSGKGYLYASQEGTTLTFTGAPYNGNGEVALDYTEGGDLAGWNLIGNPYNQDVTLYVRSGDVYDEADFYVMNDEGTNLELANRSINPMEGIFVEATAANEIACFSDGWVPSGNDMKLNLRVSDNNGNGDFARIRFGEGRTLNKFMFNENDTKLYFTQGENDYAVVRSANESEMPVNFKAEANGIYTFSVDAENMEVDYLHLIDNITGAEIDLLDNPSYSFEANTSDYAQRFRLVFATTNGINDQTTETFAIFNGSEWIISNMGEATLQVVDITGRIMSSESINGNATISTDNLSTGIYMMRLVNGNNVKVQKMVVR